MIIVTGTKRSGTSMWMQILVAAGFKPIGSQFPETWEQTLKPANPSGFYESLLRRGINYHTNPHPQSGAYLFPDSTRRHAVKVFVHGLVRSDCAYIDQVVGTMRPWREYEASIRRLCAMEVEHHGVSVTEASMLPPHLDWWAENYALIRDIAVRRYPVSLCSYDALLADPQRVVSETLQWLGGGDTAAAVAAVKPDHRTQRGSESDSFEAEVASLCDELYDLVDRRAPLSAAFVQRLNDCDEQLAPRMREEQANARRRMVAIQRQRAARESARAGRTQFHASSA